MIANVDNRHFLMATVIFNIFPCRATYPCSFMFAMYTFVCAIKVNLICKLVNFFVLAFRVLAFQGTPTHLKGSSSFLAETFSLRTVPIPVFRYVRQVVLFILVHIVFNWD